MLQCDLVATQRKDTWIYRYGYCTTELQTNATETRSLRFDDEDATYFCVPMVHLYVVSYYWCIMLVSGASGGPIAYGMFTVAEQCIFTLLVIIGSLMWSELIGTFAATFSNLNPERTVFRNRMDKLNRFMIKKGIDKKFQEELREYFINSRLMQNEESYGELLHFLSPGLQGRLSMELMLYVLDQVPFFRGVERGLICQIALNLELMLFVPAEIAPPGFLYIVQHGMAIYGDMVLRRGMVWGQDILVGKEANSARMLTYVQVLRMERALLIEIAQRFPRAYRKMRWTALRLAIKRYMSEERRKLSVTQNDFSAAFSNALSSTTKMDNEEYGVRRTSRSQSVERDRPVSFESMMSTRSRTSEAESSKGDSGAHGGMRSMKQAVGFVKRVRAVHTTSAPKRFGSVPEATKPVSTNAPLQPSDGCLGNIPDLSKIAAQAAQATATPPSDTDATHVLALAARTKQALKDLGSESPQPRRVGACATASITEPCTTILPQGSLSHCSQASRHLLHALPPCPPTAAWTASAWRRRLQSA